MPEDKKDIVVKIEDHEMTTLDELAASFMRHLLAREGTKAEPTVKYAMNVATAAYAYADGFLAVRRARPEHRIEVSIRKETGDTNDGG